MLQGLGYGFLVSAVVLVPLFIVLIMLYTWRWSIESQRRRSPLTIELIRLPAHGMRAQLDDTSFDTALYMSMAALCPVVFLAIHALDLWRHGRESLLSGNWFIYFVLAVVCIFYFSIKLVRVASLRRRLVQAVEAEFATAQHLEILKAKGCKIFHDIQAKNFNIDHVLVSPGGVFAIETKSRLKPDSGNRKDDCHVEFDGNVLKFPGWVEKKPLEQAQAQARWLQDRLTRSTGEPVKVKPVLALPGWFVDRKGRSDVAVMNPRNNEWMAKSNSDNSLDNKQIDRISFQLEQLSMADKK